MELVNGIRPKAFIFENVSAFGGRRGQKFLEEMHSVLCDYEIVGQTYNCADYGVPQLRRRFIAVGLRRDLGAIFEPPPPQSPRPTVREALSDLPDCPPPPTPHPTIPNHVGSRHSALTRERLSHIPPGENWEAMPECLRPACCHTKGQWSAKFRRLPWDEPSLTLTTQPQDNNHPFYNRYLTPREAATIQGFPLDFVFCGGLAAVYQQIGNAVPPPRAEAIGRQVRKALEGIDRGEEGVGGVNLD